MSLRLISRNGHDRTHRFREPFRGLTGPSMVLDGEMAVPDERGATHVDLLTQAMRQCWATAGLPPAPPRPSLPAYLAAARGPLDRGDAHSARLAHSSARKK